MAYTDAAYQLRSSLASKHLTDAEYIKGGYLVVSTMEELNNLPKFINQGVGSDDGIIIKGSLVRVAGSVNKTYRYNGSSWDEVLDGANSVTSITAGTGLSGGTITSAGTISHGDTSSQASMTTGGRTYVNSITLDGFGHVTALGTNTETVTDTNTTYTLSGDTASSGNTPSNGEFRVTPSEGTAYNVKVKGLGAAAFAGLDDAPTSDSNNAVKSGGVYNSIQDIREIVAGKGANYIVDATKNPAFGSNNPTIKIDSFVDVDNVLHNVSDLNAGDNVYVIQSDLPDRWIGEHTSILPAAYQETAYITLNGTQHIDTGVTGTQNTSYLIVAEAGTIETPMNLFGSRTNATTANITTGIQTSSPYNTIVDFGDYTQTRFNSIAVKDRPFVLYNSKNERYIDDNKVTTQYTGGSFSTPSTLRLGDAYQSFTLNKWVGNIYACKIWNGSSLVRDFVPCYRISDDVAGLYDIINNVFYTDANSNAFIAGPAVQNGIVLYKLETVKPAVSDVRVNGASVVVNEVANISIPTPTVDTNQTVKAKNAAGTADITFGVNDVVEIKGGTNVTVVGNSTDKTITISSTDQYTGTVTSVNNVAPVNGNVTLSIPAAQVNSDWNSTSGVSKILNKPTLATVATSGSFSDLSNKPSGTATIASVASDIVTIKNGVSQTNGAIGNSSGTDIILAKVAKTGSYDDLTDTPTIPDAPGTLDTTATTAQETNASEPLSGAIVLHQVAKTGDADSVDSYHVTGGGYIYKGNVTVTFRRNSIGTITLAQRNALTANDVSTGDIYVISDQNNREDCAIVRGSGASKTLSWSTLAAPQKDYTKLENNDDYIYVKVTSKDTYSSNFVDFFIAPSYDNIAGSTEIREYCRARNMYYANAVNYNGNKLLGIYQASANTDIWYLKFAKHVGSYTAFPGTYIGSISIYMNQQILSAQIIQPSNAEYSTVVGYSYYSLPTAGISTSSTVFDKINGTTVGTTPKFTDTNYYHKTGTWSGLTYTAAKVGSPDALAFTIPTGNTSTTVAVGNHTHTTSLASDTGTADINLSHGGKYKLTAGGTSVIFTLPSSGAAANQTVSGHDGSGAGVTFGADDIVDFIGTDRVSVVADSTAKTITIDSNLKSQSTTGTGRIAYLDSAGLTYTSASATGTATFIKTLTAGSGSFTPTTKYLGANYSPGSAYTSKTDKYIHTTKDTDFVTGVSADGTSTAVTGISGGSGTFYGTRSTAGSGTAARRKLTLTHTHTAASSTGSATVLTGVKASSTAKAVTAITVDTTAGSDSDKVFVASLTSGSVGGSVSLSTYDETSTGRIQYIESATHTHIATSANQTGDAVTGITAGSLNKTDKYLELSKSAS